MKYDPNTPYNDLPPLPPKVDVETREILKKAISASRALAELKGQGRIIPDQAMLVNSLVLQEAKASSEIENIFTTNDALFRAMAASAGAVDPATKEVLRYRQALWQGYRRILITGYRPDAREMHSGRFRYLTWREFKPVLEELAKDSNPEAKAISRSMIHYMEDHGMIRRDEPVEIYAREINEETTLAMFLKAGAYTCDYKAGSRLPEALYFAPHFGASIARNHIGIRQGISYIARIEKVEVVESWPEIRAALLEHHGKAWLKKHLPVFKSVSWLKRRKKRSLVITSTPQLVFHPPIQKESLQPTTGWLSRNFLSFQDLFEAQTK